MNLRVLIVDDEPVVGSYLKTIIEEVPGVRVAAVTTSGKEALQKAAIHMPQVVFLDIDMPDMNGLELARALLDISANINLIFATAFPDHALQAFELYSFDYILKPFNEKRIKKTLGKLLERLHSQSSNKPTAKKSIAIETPNEKLFLDPSEIQFVESRKPSTIIKTLTNTYKTRGDMETFERLLQPYDFLRCHRSYLVNPIFVKEIIHSCRTFQIVLTSGERVLLSRYRERVVRESLYRRFDYTDKK